MRICSEEFKNNISKLGRQLKSKITYTINNEEIELGNNVLNSITPSVETTLLKSVMKYLEIDSNVEIPVGTIFKYQFGLKIENEYEYIDFGNYIVKEVENKEDTNSYIIKAYDKMLYAMKDYEALNITYPITIREYITALCNKIDLTFANENDEFANYNREIQNELFLDSEGNSLGYTYRDVLDQLAEVTASNICINNDDELELRYITQEPVPPTPTPGKNMLDISQGFQLGYISTSGNFISQNQTALFNQIIEVEPGETYCFSTNANVDNLVISMFKANNVYKTRTKVSNSDRVVQLIPNDVVAIRVSVNLDGRTTMTQTIIDNLELMVEHNNTRTEPYEPYELSTNSSETTNDTEEINEQYLKNINVKFGEKFGPINSIVLSRVAESDNVYLQDEESVEQNGLCEFKIIDNQFMNFNDRSNYLMDILDKLDGLEFYKNDFDSTGITYLEVCDMYNIVIDDNIYKCLMLNDTIEITQGLTENIYTELPEETNTDYTKADKTDNRINQTWVIANKQTGEIQALTRRVETIETNTVDTYSREQINELVQDAVNGLTNTFTAIGGNNILRNTGLWFENDDRDDAENNPYEFWTGKVVRQSEDKASNNNALLLQNDTLTQQVEVKNGIYTLSFKYKKLINLADCKLVVNDIETPLTSLEDTEIIQQIEVSSRNITISFITDTDNSCEIYDLMLNIGEDKSEYAQNQNETTTDTVNIGKGITITSSDTETIFKANSDGVRIFDNKDLDNPRTKFTDKGTETDYIEVKNEANILGLYHKKVGNHIWVTKL